MSPARSSASLPPSPPELPKRGEAGGRRPPPAARASPNIREKIPSQITRRLKFTPPGANVRVFTTPICYTFATSVLILSHGIPH